MSLDVCVEGYAQTVEYYATDDIQGTQCAPLEEAPPEATIVNTSFPDYIVDELFEPGVFWFQTGPPTSADDETGQTRGQTCLPDYLEPDDQLDPSDVDWQNPTTLNDAACTFPMLQGNARSTTAAGTTHTATLPGYAAGYGVLILIATSAVETLTFPDGWQVVFNRSTTALTTNLNVAAIWRVMDGTEGSTVDITSAANETLTFQAFSFTQFDPYTGPDFAVDITAGANDDPPSLTHDWPSQKAMWIAVDFGPDNTHTVANAAVPYRTWGMFGYASGSANQYVLVGLRQIEAATENPGVFAGGSITSSATATIAIRGICYDDLNDDPAGHSIPDDLEPEAEVDCYGWQSQGPVDDPLSAPVDDLLTVTSIPDWLEPDAEPNPEDIGSGGWSMGASDDGIICYAPVVESVSLDTSSASGTSHSITLPAGIVAGDKLVMFLWTDANATVTSLTGWTSIGSGAAAEGKLYVRVADGTEGATVNVTFGSSVQQAAIIYRISTLYEGSDWYQLVSELTNDAGSPSITHTYSTGVYLTLAAVLQSGGAKTALGGFTNVQVSDTNSGTGVFGSVAQRVSEEQTVTPGSWSPNSNGDTYYTIVIPGLCIGERYETGTQWTAVTEPPEDVFEESPEWVRTPTFEFDGDTEPAPRYLPDDMDLEDEPLQDGWQQSVTVEDFPLDPEIPLTSIPADLEPEAEADTFGWQGAPLHDFPENADINGRSVPDDLEPEAEVDAFGWASEPLHDTPSTDDITGTSVPDTVLPDDEVDTDGWAFCLPDMEEPPPVAQPDPGVSVGTLPGVRPRRKWWVENISAEEKKRKKVHGTRWPDLPDVDVPKKFNPRVVTDKMVRPRLDAAHRDWKNRIRKARQRDDEIIMAIIAVLLAEGNDDT